MIVVRPLILLALLAHFSLPVAYAGDASPIPLPNLKNVETEPKHDVQMESGLKNEGDKKIADGTRLTIAHKGFSFVPPKGWERVQSNSGLLFQVQKDPSVNYQKTLQVLFFNGGVSWDKYNLTNFGKLLTERFAQRSNLISDYKLLNFAPFPLDDQNSPAEAYYTTFLYGAMPMMQLHLLVSNSSRHALVTFTDLASNFKADVVPEGHRVVYDAMKSVEFDGADGLSSIDNLKYAVAAGVSFITLFFLFRTSLSWLRFRQLKNIESLPTDQHEDSGSDLQALRDADKAHELAKKSKTSASKNNQEAEVEDDPNAQGKSDHGLDFAHDDDHQSVA